MLPCDLPSHPLFQVKNEFLTPDERVQLSYQRAQLVVRTHALTAKDVELCTDRFWALINDPIFLLDWAMFTIIAAHVGLAIGTLSRHLAHRPDFAPLVESWLRFDSVGIYLLTERGHGLDAFNIETTATKTQDGYILHTPREEAAKFMPASTPAFGMEKTALVMARLIVDGEDRGCRFFVVPICNEHEMYEGVSSIRLPPRPGTDPLDFAITRFNNVHLPLSALVAADVNDLELPADPLTAWWEEIWRIQLGTMAVPAPFVSATKLIAYIGGRYSTHRCITGKDGAPLPIISFRTQQWPVVQATAVGLVMENWFPRGVGQALHPSVDPRVQHAMSVIMKTTVCRHFQNCVFEMGERLGAQGTFHQNTLARYECDAKGVIIAEGDILTLCIRLFSELLLGRYTIPLPAPTSSRLARHAHSLLEENRALLRKLRCSHRSATFNNLILPQAQLTIEAIGHALAYTAGVEAGLPQDVLDVYECVAIRRDSAWFAEQGGMSRLQQRINEDKAVSSMVHNLGEYLDQLGLEDYVRASIVSDDTWKAYLAELPVFRGYAVAQRSDSTSAGLIQMQAML